MKKLSNDIVEGTRVRVYRNLRRSKVQKIYSVIGPNGKVIAHVSKIFLTDVKFVVRPAGREKVRRERRKNVHAFVVGTYSSSLKETGTWDDLSEKVTYNPYENEHFQCQGRDAYKARKAVVDQQGISVAFHHEY